jgi:signal transduction histidine kinase
VRVRLGLRISIQERVASVGGSAQICAELGRGTTITIEWPADESVVDNARVRA